MENTDPLSLANLCSRLWDRNLLTLVVIRRQEGTYHYFVFTQHSLNVQSIKQLYTCNRWATSYPNREKSWIPQPVLSICPVLFKKATISPFKTETLTLKLRLEPIPSILDARRSSNAEMQAVLLSGMERLSLGSGQLRPGVVKL